MVKSFKTNLLTWLKTKTYIKTEIDEKLNGKADSNHKHNDVSAHKQVNTIYPDLPVYFMIKNGWCIIQFDNPIQYLTDLTIDIPREEWFLMGDVPIPQTGEVYQQLSYCGIDCLFQITTDGRFLFNTDDPQVKIYGTLVYPTEETIDSV